MLRRDLLERAEKSGERLADAIKIWNARRRGAQRLAVRVIGVRGKSEANGRVVRFVVSRQNRRQASGLTEDEWQESGRHRIERAGVTDLSLAGHRPQARDNIVRRRTRGFVDEKYAIHRSMA